MAATHPGGTESIQTNPSASATIYELKPAVHRSLKRNSNYQAYQILHVALAVAPLIAGTDKFFNRLVNWEQYLDPEIPKRWEISHRDFMQGVGILEIAVGIGVALKPKIFGYVASGWLLAIIGNLLKKRGHYDIALRDFGLSLGALALSRLSPQFEKRS